MSKKIITTCMALFALAAFILPAAVPASPEITHPTGTRLDPSTGSCTAVSGTICITATNLGETKIRNTENTSTLVTCTTASMTGTLTENSGMSIKGNITSTSFSGTGPEGRCTDSFGAAAFVDTNIGNGTPWCLSASGTENTFTVRGNECAKEVRSITFVLTDSLIGTCKYSRTTSVSGTFTTHSTGDAILTVAPSATGSAFTKEEGNVLCPASGLLEMKFTLETDTATAEPLYISPAAVPASPVITHPTGTRLDPSTGSCTAVSGTICITATNLGETKIRNTENTSTLVTCTTASMTGTLTENSGTLIKANITNTSFGGDGSEGRCTDSFGAGAFYDTNIGNGTPWCLQASGSEDKFTVRGNECSKESRSITFVLTDSVIGACKYSRTATLNGTFTTHSTGDAIIAVAPSTTGSAFSKEEGSALCPASELLEMKFTLETDTTAASDPLYIS